MDLISEEDALAISDAEEETSNSDNRESEE